MLEEYIYTNFFKTMLLLFLIIGFFFICLHMYFKCNLFVDRFLFRWVEKKALSILAKVKVQIGSGTPPNILEFILLEPPGKRNPYDKHKFLTIQCKLLLNRILQNYKYQFTQAHLQTSFNNQFETLNKLLLKRISLPIELRSSTIPHSNVLLFQGHYQFMERKP